MKAKLIVKAGECLNLSAKYKIKYHIGIDEQDSIILRVHENEGGGYFSSEWIKLQTILDKLDSAKKPITSFSLHGIFEGKSSNTPGFIFAVIYAEGLVERDIENPRVYVSCDPKPVIETIEALIKSGVDIKVVPTEKSKPTPSKPVKNTSPSKAFK